MFVGDVLDIAGKDFDSQLFHISGGFCHHLVREGVTVRVDSAQRQGSNDLAHISLKGILQIHGDLGRFLVQEVLHCQLHPFRLIRYPDFGHRIHGHVDEIVGGNKFIRFNIHGNLPQIQLIQLLKKGNLKPGPAYQYPRLLPEAGDDIGVIRRSFYIALGDNDNEDQNNEDCRQETE